jgi:thiol-disulfide isomerase/thioredoxin
MKFLKLLSLLTASLLVQDTLAQTDSHLKLTSEYPKAGEKIILTYGPSGTATYSKKYKIMPEDRSPTMTATTGITVTLMNDPAPGFILKDIGGKTVSLSDYKGKIIVLDFWATWCEPCIKSFPAMQIVINKYKDDPDIKFLFIDTREKSINYIDLVKNFFSETNYSFEVLFDEKGTDGIQNKIFKQFAVKGLPTKVIIDGQAKIRYESTGYIPDMNSEDDAKEFSAIIESIRNGN